MSSSRVIAVPGRALSLVLAPLIALAVLAAPPAGSSASSAAVSSTTSIAARFYAHRMLRLLNKERARHELRPLRMSSKLVSSARRHNVAMARADTLSHQLPGEAFFATRISRAHYAWSVAGENIGWNSQMSIPGLLYLERLMFREHAPDNGHRLNILTRGFRNIGIDVYFDRRHHKMWFTQDFGRPA
jgi:uncharacterized protein YkwD